MGAEGTPGEYSWSTNGTPWCTPMSLTQFSATAQKCLAMLKKGEALGVRILLPVDVLVADRLEVSEPPPPLPPWHALPSRNP